MKQNIKAVIIAGGFGRRLGLPKYPKSMASIGGIPLIEHQIILLKSYNITEIIILTGYMSEIIQDYFGDGKKWGVEIEFVKENSPLGTAGAVKQLENKINDRFIVIYGDLMINLDFDAFINYDKKYSNYIATIITHPNNHPLDSDLVEVNESNEVTAFLSKPHSEDILFNNIVNAAIYILSKDIFQYIKENEFSDFGKDIFPLIVKKNTHKIKIYNSVEYIKDIGRPVAYANVEHDYRNGLIKKFNRLYKRKAIFIDRDGVLNYEKDVIKNLDDFKIFKKVHRGINMINESEYLAIVITNQPAIAKGWITFSDLLNIHKKLETYLGLNKTYLNKIYFCPHHPEKGFEGEVSELKIDCECRKPKIGMILKAVEEFNIDLSNSYLIGDSTTDIQTGINAGVKTILVKTGKAGSDKIYDCTPNFVVKNLFHAVRKILYNK